MGSKTVLQQVPVSFLLYARPLRERVLEPGTLLSRVHYKIKAGLWLYVYETRFELPFPYSITFYFPFLKKESCKEIMNELNDIFNGIHEGASPSSRTA